MSDDSDRSDRTDRPTSVRAIASVAVGIAIVVVGLAFVVGRLVDRWDEVRPLLAEASVPWAAATLLLAVVAMALIGRLWVHCLALLGAPAPVAPAMGWFAAGQLGKYVPGGIWHVVGQGELARRSGIARPVAYASVLLASIALYGAAGVAAVVLGAVAGGVGPAVALGALTTVGALLVFEPRLLDLLVRRFGSMRLPSRSASWRYVAANLTVWAAVAGATAATARALDADADLAVVAAAAVGSWLVGFLALPAPGGLGAREAAFVLFAEDELGGSTAAAVALVARVAFLTADLALPGIVALVRGGLSRGGRTPSSTGADGPRSRPSARRRRSRRRRAPTSG
ncbi:MAG: lysylphosphatidylglycerol synthase domain-containing protein [Actinomycetota bacterium]